MKTWLCRSLAAVLLCAPLLVRAQALSCTAVTTAVSFGVIDPSAGEVGQGTIQVTCLNLALLGTVGYQVALSPGNGSYASRQMASGGQMLNYNLYTSAAHTSVWGDGTGGSSMVSGSVSLLSPSNTHTVYGQIPGSQNVPAGTYTDTLTVTVTY